ncbi:unnamed protein product, partial [Mesorhabditis spiculigera]
MSIKTGTSTFIGMLKELGQSLAAKQPQNQQVIKGIGPCPPTSFPLFVKITTMTFSSLFAGVLVAKYGAAYFNFKLATDDDDDDDDDD